MRGVRYTIVLIACQIVNAYHKYIGGGPGRILVILLGHVVTSTMDVKIPVRGPGLILLLVMHTLLLKDNLPKNKLPISKHEHGYSGCNRRGYDRRWSNRDKVRRIRRVMIEAHRADRGHRTVARARFEQASRIVRKERSSCFGVHLHIRWGPLFGRRNIWLRQRRRILGRDLMRAVRRLREGFVMIFGAVGGGDLYDVTPLGLEAPGGTNDCTAWVWQELLDDMIAHERKVNKNAFDSRLDKQSRDVVVACTMDHAGLMRMLSVARSTEGATGYEAVDLYRLGNTTSIVPYLREGDTHCSLLILAPGEVLLFNPCGYGKGARPPEMEQASRTFGSPNRGVGIMNLRLQDSQDVANCGPWVALMAGMVQLWDCYRQAREGGSWASLQGGIQDIMTVRGLEDLSDGTTESSGNTDYIWGTGGTCGGMSACERAPGSMGRREPWSQPGFSRQGKRNAR
jgi:hypothetical protein